MFSGFPEAALDFYDDLEADNSRSFWTAHAEVYESCVRSPMQELANALTADFGERCMGYGRLARPDNPANVANSGVRAGRTPS